MGLKDDDWFAGFVDGEGHFGVVQRVPRLAIDLRLDDAAILDEIQATFGGSISIRRKSTTTSHPQGAWMVAMKSRLLDLVTYFDAHPLRAKKANDYVIWRRIVRVYVVGGRTHPDIPALSMALRAGRAYDAAEVALPDEVSDQQLRLVVGGD